MKPSIKQFLLGALFVFAQTAVQPALAHQGPQAPEGFVGDRNGHVVTDNYGGCVRTGFAAADAKCAEPAVAKQEPAPVPAPAPAPVPKTETMTLGATTLFDFNKSQLRPAGKQKLDDIVAKIKSHQQIDGIVVTGHTDSIGTDAYNQKLSERRANTVRDYLVGAGIDAKLITARGMGKSKPVASNDTAEGRQQNRRVEVEVTSRN